MNADTTHKQSETDWARVDAMTDDEIDFSDSPELTEEWFARAKLVMPKGQPQEVELKVHIDRLTAAWYAAQGEDRDRRIRAALRIYATAHKD